MILLILNLIDQWVHVVVNIVVSVNMNEVRTPLREVRLRVACCFVVAFLAVDAINPVKVICGILGISTSYVALFALVYVGAITYSNGGDLTYFMVKVFFHSLISIFFSSVEVLGRQHIPEHGPVIFTGNHMNQFVDAAVMVITSPLRVGFLVAEVSFKKAIIGVLARAAGGIPVSRPQDMAKKGPGQVQLVGLKMIGEGTAFNSLKKGDKLRPGRSPNAYRVRTIVSDTEVELGEEKGESSPQDEPQNTMMDYDILSAVDQSKMFDTVQGELARGKCLGIFPEGGSHDRTDLLPLKVGVAAIAFGVHDKFERNVPIIPVGLNYFRGHRFRGKVVVEFGEPISIDDDTLAVYKKSKRDGYQTLLAKVEEGMRSVIVTAPDYGELKLIHTARRLWQSSPGATGNPTKYRQEVARRFAVAYQVLKEKFNGEENLPEELLSLKERIVEYQDALDNWGLYDYQVKGLQVDVPFNTLLYTFVHAFIVIALAAVPSLFLNAPVGLAASWYASKERKKDLAKSRVKLFGRDVLMSKKILFSLVAVPVLWVTYAVLLCLFTNWEFRTIFVLFLSFPFFAYIGVTGLGMGMVDMKDLRPAFLRLLPGFRAVTRGLPKQRARLQKDIRAIVAKYGPELGAVYTDKSEKWEKRVNLKAASLTRKSPEEGNESKECSVKEEPDAKDPLERQQNEDAPSGDNEQGSDFHFSTGIACSLPPQGEVPRSDSAVSLSDEGNNQESKKNN